MKPILKTSIILSGFLVLAACASKPKVPEIAYDNIDYSPAVFEAGPVMPVGSALALLFIAGAVLIALDPPDWKSGTQSELYQTKRKTKPAGLDKLPSSYDRIPKLGPPNPGDIGKSLARLESDLGIKPPAINQTPSYRPDPEADFLRAERIRLARLKSQAQESGVFFTISRKRSTETDIKTNGENGNRANNRQIELDVLTALTNAVGTSPDAADASPDPNGQKSKLAFLQKGFTGMYPIICAWTHQSWKTIKMKIKPNCNVKSVNIAANVAPA